jgi:Ca2+/Na+ antiporter
MNLFDVEPIMACPAVCTQQTYVYISMLGLLFGVLAIVLFLLRKKVLSKWRPILFWIFLVLFLLFSVQIRFESCGSGCSRDGVYFQGLRMLPNMDNPYYFF